MPAKTKAVAIVKKKRGRPKGTPNVIVCGAKLRNKNAYCKAPPMKNGKCRKHGGLTPKGFACSSTVHGRYSKYIPQSLGASYKDSLSDPELLHLRSEIALMDTRITELLSQLKDIEESPESSDVLLRKELWFDIGAFTDNRRKLVESERKRAIETQQIMTTDRVMELMQLILTIITKHVHDKTAIERISNDIGAIVH